MCHGRVTVAQRVTCLVRSEVCTAVMQMIEVFWDVVPCFLAGTSVHRGMR